MMFACLVKQAILVFSFSLQTLYGTFINRT